MAQGGMIGDRYRLGGRLGIGGMAEVRLGLDVQLGRGVAIKLLLPDVAGDPDARARFQAEARSVASLNHPSIVRVFDTGEVLDPVTGASTPYIVMELVEGKTLSTLLRTEPKMSPRRALRVTRGILDALEQSHAAGIVHQDIKPGNVMVTSSGEVKVMDFGIARNVAEAATTVPGACLRATPKYLAPEQARGHTGDARSDIYSTGCLLYELLTGRPPFIGSSQAEIIEKHIEEAPQPPSAADPRLSPDLDRLILKALAKDPGDRYQSAREMNADVIAFMTGARTIALARRALADPSLPPAMAATVIGDQWGHRVAGPLAAVSPRSPWVARRRRAVGSGALAVVLLTAGGFALHANGPATTADQVTSAAVLSGSTPSAQASTPAKQTVRRTYSSTSPTKSATPKPPRKESAGDEAVPSARSPIQLPVAHQYSGAKAPLASNQKVSAQQSSGQKTSGQKASDKPPSSARSNPPTVTKRSSTVTPAPAAPPTSQTRPTPTPSPTPVHPPRSPYPIIPDRADTPPWAPKRWAEKPATSEEAWQSAHRQWQGGEARQARRAWQKKAWQKKAWQKKAWLAKKAAYEQAEERFRHGRHRHHD